jgi:hypothetical protein
MLNPPTALPGAVLRANCARELFTIAEALRRTGRHRRLGDITIVLPADLAAVEAVELACLALAEGEFSEAAADLDRKLDSLAGDPATVERFLRSVRGVVRRVGQGR